MDILALLQWLLPSGGVGLVLGWITSRRIRLARSRREEHDTYMHMYDDTQDTLLRLSQDNQQMLLRLSRVEAALAKAYRCRYLHQCPLRHELQQLSETMPQAERHVKLRDYLRSHEPQGTADEDDGTRSEREYTDDPPHDRPP